MRKFPVGEREKKSKLYTVTGLEEGRKEEEEDGRVYISHPKAMEDEREKKERASEEETQ